MPNGCGRSVRKHVDSPGDLKFAAPPLPVDPVELDRLKRLLGSPPRLARGEHASGRGDPDRPCPSHCGRDPSGLADHHRAPAPRPRAGLVGGTERTSAGGWQDPPQDAGIWIADTMGELGLMVPPRADRIRGTESDPVRRRPEPA